MCELHPATQSPNLHCVDSTYLNSNLTETLIIARPTTQSTPSAPAQVPHADSLLMAMRNVAELHCLQAENQRLSSSRAPPARSARRDEVRARSANSLDGSPARRTAHLTRWHLIAWCGALRPSPCSFSKVIRHWCKEMIARAIHYRSRRAAPWKPAFDELLEAELFGYTSAAPSPAPMKTAPAQPAATACCSSTRPAKLAGLPGRAVARAAGVLRLRASSRSMTVVRALSPPTATWNRGEGRSGGSTGVVTRHGSRL